MWVLTTPGKGPHGALDPDLRGERSQWCKPVTVQSLIPHQPSSYKRGSEALSGQDTCSGSAHWPEAELGTGDVSSCQ